MTTLELPLITILLIVAAHLVGDWLLQNTWMAENKGKSHKALTAHALVYTTSLLVFSFLIPLGWVWVLMNGMAHFFVDYYTSRWCIKAGFGKPLFWKIIGLDQATHYAILFTTASLMIS